MRPIASGCTIRRLVAKVACTRAADEISSLLLSRQLGFKVKGGIEAAVHCARLYLNQMPSTNALLKFDFKNAFNSLHRINMLQSVRERCPDLYPFVRFTLPIQLSLFSSGKAAQFHLLKVFSKVILLVLFFSV